MKRPGNLQLIILLFMIALVARLLPLTYSSLPYNIDGFPLARISEMIISTGNVPDHHLYSGLLAYNLKLPVFPLLLSTFSMTLGITPLQLLPYFCALIGSMSVVIIYALVLRFTKNQLAAFSAGLFLALTGLFVYITTAAMKELVAIVLFCLLIFLFNRRKDWRYRLLASVILILLPFVHHLTTLVAYITITIVALSAIFMDESLKRFWSKNVVKELVFGPCLGLVALLYYRYVGMEFFSNVNNLNDSVLLLSVCLLALLFTMFLIAPVRTRPWFIFKNPKKEKGISLSAVFDEKVLFFIFCFAVLFLNSRKRLFASSPMTSEALLTYVIPYMLLVVIALVGYNLIRYTRFKDKAMITALFMTPFALMTYAALRGLDIFNFTLIFRSYNFIDIPIAISVGIGTSYLIKLAVKYSKQHREFRALPIGVFSIFCILCLTSLPLAYNNLETFGIQETTYEYELETLEWIAAANITIVSTDQRYKDIIGPYYDVESDWTLPWRINRNAYNDGEIMVVTENWITIGAQMSILDRVVITKETFNELLAKADVVYVGGPDPNAMYVLVAGNGI